MWSAIVILLYAFVALSTALKSNFSLLESKVQAGKAFQTRYVHPRKIDFVVSIRYEERRTKQFVHICMGCMVTTGRGVAPQGCRHYREGEAHYVTTAGDEYSDRKLKPIDHFEKPTDIAFSFRLDFFVMKDPIWREDNSPVFANFQYGIDLYHPGDMDAMLWDSFGTNILLGQNLLKIPISITDAAPDTECELHNTYNIKISDDQTFEFTEDDRGGPVYIGYNLVGMFYKVKKDGSVGKIIRFPGNLHSAPCTHEEEEDSD